MIPKIKHSSLLSGSAVYLLSNLLSAVIPFALLPVLTRYLDPAEYGEVAMFQTLVGALSAFVGLNVASAANRKYYDEHHGDEDLRDFNAACLQILLVSTATVFIVVWLIRELLAEWLGISARWVLWSVAMAAFAFILQLRLGQWQVRKNAANYGLLQTAQSVLNAGLSVAFVVVLLEGASGRISAQVVAGGACAVIALLLLQRDGLLRFATWRGAHVREALAFGVPLIPHLAGLFLLASVDRLVVKTQLGVAEVGIYMVAVQLAAGLSLVFDAVNKAYVPWLFERLKRNHPDEKRQIVRYTYAWFLVILIGSAVGFLLGPSLVLLIAGERYAPAGNVIGWLALGQGFGGMYLMVTNYVFYSKQTGTLSAITLTSGLVNVLLVILLTKLAGLTGAAIAFAIAMALRFFHTWWVAQRRHPMPWFNIRVQN